MRILSIDPGISGALALLEYELQGPIPHPRVIEVLDMPIMARKKDGTGNLVNYTVLSHEIDRRAPNVIVLEQVTGQLGRGTGQKMGNSGAFNFGMGFGIVLGCCSRLPIILVRAAAWKKRLGIPGRSANTKEARKTDDYARVLALRIFPYLAEQLARKKDVGRAEAALIGLDYVTQLRADGAAADPIVHGTRWPIVPTGYTAELELGA